ncbi:hypothetical protein FHS60_001204 [Alloprevotella rava]|uniref:Uncharacterized protein n=1 Tax=Alloprevotella rava TaxID=671218 RepID=A0A7W5UIY8_9BACT|nr:hypothetical protein [Alloprevotella rava]
MSGRCKVHISIHFLEKIPEAKKYIIDFFVHILIAFENTIRLSADILIASADALIVAEQTVRKTEAKRIHPLLLFCFRVVTSSRCHVFAIMNWKCAYCERDNSVTTKSIAKFIVTHLSNYISACLLHTDNVTTKSDSFSRGRKRAHIPQRILYHPFATHIRFEL